MAEPRPGRNGTITSGMPSSRASSTRVERPGAAEGDQREVARVVAPLHRDEPDRACHVGAHDAQDAGRGFRPRIAQGRRDPVDGLLRQARGAAPPGPRAWSRRRAGRAPGSHRSPWAGSRPDRSRQGPGLAPALAGPTLSTPPSSMRAMEPPPAPMAVTSTEGKLMTMLNSMFHSGRISARPRRESETSALVPPTSRTITSGLSASRPMAAPAITPAPPAPTGRCAPGCAAPPRWTSPHRRNG